MQILQERIKRITDTTVIVGIDIAKEIHWARITDHRGIDLIKAFKVHNSIDGFENLLTKVEKIRKKHDCDQVMIGMEPSGHYWRALGWYLKLHDSEPILVGVNPFHVKQTKELVDNSQTKSDPKDALVIAHLIKNGSYFDTYLPECEYADLRQLNSERQRIIKQINRTNNQLIAHIDEYFPEYSTVWKDVACLTSLEMLKTYTFPSDILSAKREKLLEDIRVASGGIEGLKLMEDMIRVSKRSVGVKEGQRIVRIRIINLIEDMAHFEKDKAAIEAELESTMNALEIGNALQSVPGVATIISSAFLGEVGDVSRFTSWKQVRSLAGLNLVEDSSGQRKGNTKVSKRGRPYLRHMLYMAGENGVRNNPEMNKYYRYLRDRKKNPLEGNQAIVAVGLKMMRMLFHIAKTGERYDSSKALGEVRLQQIASLTT